VDFFLKKNARTKIDGGHFSGFSSATTDVRALFLAWFRWQKKKLLEKCCSTFVLIW
jgi:hypothetical protein